MLKPSGTNGITLEMLSTPAKALVTSIIITIGLGMAGALGQIIVHDIVPTFFSEDAQSDSAGEASYGKTSGPGAENDVQTSKRGDLFKDLEAAPPQEQSNTIDTEQLIWTLKWTHIHLFGINMIFIFMGGITLLLNIGNTLKTWLIVLPFAGILIDIATMWLKGFVSPAFFWLHIPGGGVFTAVFVYVSLRALWDMWLSPQKPVNN